MCRSERRTINETHVTPADTPLQCVCEWAVEEGYYGKYETAHFTRRYRSGES